MRICVLENTPPEVDGCTTDFTKYLPDCTFDKLLILKNTAARQIQALGQKKIYDCFINLCDGPWDDETAGIEAIQALERFHLPFTGSGSDFFVKTKEQMKVAALFTGVTTPQFTFAYQESDIAEAAQYLKYPMIVKHYNGYSSISMTPKSKVNNEQELLEQANMMIKEYGGALIEEFIEGREFTVLVSENPQDPENPIVLQGVECKFLNGETFKHYELKWKGLIVWEPVTDKSIADKLEGACRKVWKAIEGTGYGRFDFRYSEDGTPYFLEVNPNCGIFYANEKEYGSADNILKYDKMGFTGFLNLMIKVAFMHHEANKCRVQYRVTNGFGMYAMRDIKKGEEIEHNEEKHHTLVSRKFVETQWSPEMQLWFKRYAYPLSSDVWVINSDIDNWRPVNHFIAPNAKLDGLNVAASRDIKRGETISFF